MICNGDCSLDIGVTGSTAYNFELALSDPSWTLQNPSTQTLVTGKPISYTLQSGLTITATPGFDATLPSIADNFEFT